AEDGIRDGHVTGVQTCALPILMKETGCGAFKLEGGRRMAETIRFLVERGVPVMGHIGLTPQSINTIGSFRAQGRDEADWGPIEEIGRASCRERVERAVGEGVGM